MPTTTSTTFPSGTDRCAAWITRPDGPGPWPAVLLVHGLGATHGMRLDQYEQAFARAGIATFAFDFRHLGDSGGKPRQLVSLRRQLADVDAALATLRRLPDVAADRIAIWGTSMGAARVLLTAARRTDLAAAVVQCPVVDTRDAALGAGLRHVLRLAGPIADDLLRALLRLPRRYIPIVDEPGSTALVTTPGAAEGWYGMAPAGVEFDNRVAAALGARLLLLDASRVAARVSAPLLVCLADHETLTDPRIAARVAERAPHGRAIHYPADHFGVYHPPLVEGIVADQVTFLTRHLGVQETVDA